MSRETERLLSLLDFARDSVLLRIKPVSTVAQHGLFSLFEEGVDGLPAVEFDGDDEVWLRVLRLEEAVPPPVDNATLLPWVTVESLPSRAPTLLTEIDSTKVPGYGEAPGTIRLEDYELRQDVEDEFERYVQGPWQAWADIEGPRRETIDLYNRLFMLKQQLEGSIVESQIELVWGVGVALQRSDGSEVKYPVISQFVELSLDPETAALEVRPRDLDPAMELAWFSANNNAGVPDVERFIFPVATTKGCGELLKTTYS